jgi:hypothetical protein
MQFPYRFCADILAPEPQPEQYTLIFHSVVRDFPVRSETLGQYLFTGHQEMPAPAKADTDLATK